MVMLCGEGHTPQGRGSEVLSKMPPDGDVGAWTRGATVGATAISGTTTTPRTTRTHGKLVSLDATTIGSSGVSVEPSRHPSA
jgi:hypothetical protein